MVPVRKALASRCAQSLGARSRVMGVLASTDWERSVSAIFSAEIRFNRGDWAKLIDKASRRAPSNAASPVEFAKSPMSSVSLSVSLTLSPGYQRAPATAKRRSSPARKSLVFMKAFRSGDLLAPERARVRSRILRAKAEEMPGGQRRTEDGHVRHGGPSAPGLVPKPGRGKRPNLVNRRREHYERAGKVIEGRHGQGVVFLRDALPEHHINGKAERARHGDGIALDRQRVHGYPILGGEHGNARERDQHADNLVCPGAFEAQKDRQEEDVDRPETHNHGGVADWRKIQANREAHLVDRHAKEAKVKESPEVAEGEPSAAKIGCFGKGT